MALIVPERLQLTLCPWLKLHEARGDRHFVALGKTSGVPTNLRFNEYNFVNPSVGFVFEFTRYFKDRILEVYEENCPDCQKELEKQLNTEIIDSGCAPPKEEK